MHSSQFEVTITRHIFLTPSRFGTTIARWLVDRANAASRLWKAEPCSAASLPETQPMFNRLSSPGTRPMFSRLVFGHLKSQTRRLNMGPFFVRPGYFRLRFVSPRQRL